ncbi:MAG: hypothetical protein IJS15_03920 [Victivallales bacterium]|nr:hypothetical protein [Victivallales bacterium]
MKFASPLPAALLCLLLSSCYHLGVPGGHKNVQVGDIINRSAEPSLGGIMSSCLAEELSVRPALRVADAAKFTVDVKIVGIGNSSQARAEVRIKNARDNDSDAYQTVLHRLTVRAEYTVTDDAGKTMLKGKVIGQTSVPLMHDREVALRTARKQAVLDAARQIADALADNGGN